MKLFIIYYIYEISSLDKTLVAALAVVGCLRKSTTASSTAAGQRGPAGNVSGTRERSRSWKPATRDWSEPELSCSSAAWGTSARLEHGSRRDRSLPIDSVEGSSGLLEEGGGGGWAEEGGVSGRGNFH